MVIDDCIRLWLVIGTTARSFVMVARISLLRDIRGKEGPPLLSARNVQVYLTTLYRYHYMMVKVVALVALAVGVVAVVALAVGWVVVARVVVALVAPVVARVVVVDCGVQCLPPHVSRSSEPPEPVRPQHRAVPSHPSHVRCLTVPACSHGILVGSHRVPLW